MNTVFGNGESKTVHVVPVVISKHYVNKPGFYKKGDMYVDEIDGVKHRFIVEEVTTGGYWVHDLGMVNSDM